MLRLRAVAVCRYGAAYTPASLKPLKAICRLTRSQRFDAARFLVPGPWSEGVRTRATVAYPFRAPGCGVGAYVRAEGRRNVTVTV